jgi:hypothetical protein
VPTLDRGDNESADDLFSLSLYDTSTEEMIFGSDSSAGDLDRSQDVQGTSSAVQGLGI